MPSRLANLEPAFADLLSASDADPVIAELRRQNLARAIADGSLDAEYRLGLLIGRMLCDQPVTRKQEAR